MSRLHEKFQVARGQHEQQLAEMAALREEERQKANLDKETLCSDMERALRDLQRSHQQEKETAEDKVNYLEMLVWEFSSELIFYSF